MSHSSRDAVGGHAGTWIVWDDGFYSTHMIGRRWAKKFNRREARREARAITAAAVAEFEAEIEEARLLVEEEEDAWWDQYNDDVYYDFLEESRLEEEYERRMSEACDDFAPQWFYGDGVYDRFTEDY